MSKPSYVCVTCGEDFTRKSSARRHKANPNIHSDGNCDTVRFIDYVIGIASGMYKGPSTIPPRLSSISSRKNKFVGDSKNIVKDVRVSTFPDLSKNIQSEPDKSINISNSIGEMKNEDEMLHNCIGVASKALELRNLLEELSGGGQGSPLVLSPSRRQNEEDNNESTKPTFMDDAINKAKKLVKLKCIMQELRKGGSSCSPVANAFSSYPSFEDDTFMLDRKDVFGFSAKECRDCISFEIVPQHFDTVGNEGFHRVPQMCRQGVVPAYNLYWNILYQDRLYQNRKDLIVSSIKLIESWTEREVGMYAIDITDYTGDSLAIKHPESDTKLIRVPVGTDVPIYLDVSQETQVDEEKGSWHWLHKVVGKKQMVPLKRSDLVRFLIKTNGSSYGIFKIPQITNGIDVENLWANPQSKTYFIYIARYQDPTSRMVGDDYYGNHDCDSDSSLGENERQNDELKDSRLSIIQQPRNSKMLIAIVLAMHITGWNLHRPLFGK